MCCTCVVVVVVVFAPFSFCRVGQDHTQVRLLYACKCPEDLLLKSELDALALQHPDRFQVRYLVESATSPSDSATTSTSANGGWWPSWQRPATTNNTKPSQLFKDGRNLAVGRVNPEAMRDFLPAPTDAAAALLVCGPPGMMRFLCGDDSKQRGQVPPLGGLLAQEGYGKAVRVIPFSDRNTV
jgi:cytochrome-b5 reductase